MTSTISLLSIVYKFLTFLHKHEVTKNLLGLLSLKVTQLASLNHLLCLIFLMNQSHSIVLADKNKGQL